MKLGHVLQSALRVSIELDRFRSDELKQVARFWVGKEAGSYNKDKCIAALTKALNSESSAQHVRAALSDKQQQVLAIFTRYGPTVPGGVLTAEIYARGLAERPPKDQNPALYYRSYYEQRRNDLVCGLCEKLVLVGNTSRLYYSSSYDRCYPRLTLHPALVKAVEPAAPLSWSNSRGCDEAVGSCRRSSAEVALDLWRVATALRAMGTWPAIQGNSPSKATRAQLHKEVRLRHAEQDPLAPPDPESLYYELLHSMGLIDFRAAPSWIRQEGLEQHLQQPPPVQAWQWVRAWLHMPLWQDGIGVVPDRDSDYSPVRIEPSKLYNARELLAWALCGVAHGPDVWLDLETFLRDLWQATREASIDFYWGSYSWDPNFEMARTKERVPAGDDRTLAFWLADEAVWAANAIMVTLATLGLVERGQTSGKKSRPCFRLTELGRVVFGAPEVEAAQKSGDAHFLTVQPNLEVVAYLDSADARQICTLTRFAAGASPAGGPVQTFALRRESIYGALESGMTLDEIRTFLIEHGKTELPANVVRVLSEWAGRRESLVLRTKVVLALGPMETGMRGRALGNAVFLLPAMSVKKAAQEYAGWTVFEHQGAPARTWTADELGSLTISGGDSIARLRLASIADHTEAGWQITKQSVLRARVVGISAEQIFRWLGEHLTEDTPALLEMAVRNWTGRQGVRLGQVQLLQVVQPQARKAILHSATFRPFLAGYIPPEWFVVRDDQLSDVRRLLETLGFSISGSLEPPQPETPEGRTKDLPEVISRIKRSAKRNQAK